MADRPIPQVTVADWTADPDASLGASMELAQQLWQAAEGIGWGWLGIAATLLWSVGRVFLPGMWATIGDVAFKVLVPKQTRQQDTLTYAVSGGGIGLLEEINANPTFRSLVTEHLDEDKLADVLIALKALRDEKKPTP